MAQNYIVLEITRNANGNIAVYPSATEQEDSAYAKYYEILARAATSNSPVHAGALLNYEGFEIEYKCFKHEAPEPEGE